MTKARSFINLVHDAGFTLETLSRQVKLHPTALCHIGARRRPVRFDRALMIAKALRVSPEVLQQSFRRAG